MAKVNPRLEVARKSYREALESARAAPTPEAWARLLSAGKELSAAEEAPRSRRGRRPAPRPEVAASPADNHLEGLE